MIVLLFYLSSSFKEALKAFKPLPKSDMTCGSLPAPKINKINNRITIVASKARGVRIDRTKPKLSKSALSFTLASLLSLLLIFKVEATLN